MTTRKGLYSIGRLGDAATRVAGLGAVLIGASSALAQGSPNAPNATGLEEVVVTATRRNELQIETPVAVSTINNDDFIGIGIADINALADFVPGLAATDGGAPGLGNLVIRGLYAGSGSSTVGIYIDDVPFGPVVGGAGSSLALDASLFDLSRIEVVRGPQGTLFGASAMGGVVRYVTREPSLEKLEGFGFVDYSDTDGGGGNTLLRGGVSVPIVEDKFAVSVSGFYSDTSGYTDNPLRGKKGVDDGSFSGGLLSARAALTDALQLRFNAMHQEASYDAVAAEAFDLTTGDRILGKREDIATQPTPRDLSFDLVSLVVDFDFSWATLTSATSWQNLDFKNRSDLTESFGPLADALAPDGAPHTVGFESAFDTDRFTQEFRLTSPDSDRLEWIAGVYYTDQSTDDTQDVLPQPDDLEILNASLPTDYEEYAAFGNVTYYITPRWDATIGLRYSDIETSVDAQISGSPFVIGPGPFPSGTTNSDDVFTYLVNTRYRISDDVNIYARAASGFRPGGANLIVEVGGTKIGDPNYKSDDLWSYEAGIKGRLMNGRVTYDVGAYLVDWQDAQLANQLSGLGATTNAVGKVRATGLEASVTAEPIDGLTIVGSAAIVDSELQSDEPVLGGIKGESLPNTPDANLALSADYVFALSTTWQASFGATWRFTGEYNTSFEGGGNVAPPLPNHVNEAYDQLDLRTGLRRGPLTANLYVTNVTNEDAYQTIFPIAPTYAQGIILRPRTYGLNLRYDF